jgi:hypothetical protein
MDASDRQSPDDAMKALVELFSDPRIPNHAHFRYRIDPPTEEERALDAAFNKAFGSDSKRARWVRRLRARQGIVES